jgi:hypothetical protein
MNKINFSDKRTKDLLQQVFLWILQSVVFAIVIGLVINFASWNIVQRFEQKNFERISNVREKFSGTWRFKIKIRSSFDKLYEGITFFEIVSLTVDNQLNVSGVAQRYADGTDYQNILIYPRGDRKVSHLNGSIINNKLLLNGESFTSSNVPSIDFYSSRLESEVLVGTYFSDVAMQSGDLCGVKVTQENLQDLYYDFKNTVDQGEKVLFDCLDEVGNKPAQIYFNRNR